MISVTAWVLMMSRDERLVAHVADDERRHLGRAERKPVDRLSITTTVSPASASVWTMWLPM